MESTSESVPNSFKITPTMLEGSDADIKIRVMKEVRKPGRNYEKIFSLLEEVQGPMDIQKYFIEFAIKEAARHYESAPEASQVHDFSSLSSCEEVGDSSGGLGTRCALEALKGNAFKNVHFNVHIKEIIFEQYCYWITNLIL